MNTKRFEGKIVLVTGGNSGLGLAAAEAFGREGAQVVITGRNQETLNQAEKKLGSKALAIKADLSHLDEIERVIRVVTEKLGRIDVLFANAGVAKFGSIESVTEADWDAVMGTNLKGLFFTVQKTVPLMKKGSAIVLNASVVAGKGYLDNAVYAASKAGVRSLGRTLAASLVDHGIRVNVVSPGPIETPIWKRTQNEDRAQQSMARNPMKRLGTPEEVASAVLYLASPEASYVTGVDLLVDGGAGSL